MASDPDHIEQPANRRQCLRREQHEESLFSCQTRSPPLEDSTAALAVGCESEGGGERRRRSFTKTPFLLAGRRTAGRAEVNLYLNRLQLNYYTAQGDCVSVCVCRKVYRWMTHPAIM